MDIRTKLISACILATTLSPAFAEDSRPDYDLDNDGLIEINDIKDLANLYTSLDGSSLYGSSTGCPSAGCIGFELTQDLSFDVNGDGAVGNEYNLPGIAGLPPGYGPPGWGGIGTESTPFSAVLEGNGHTISYIVFHGGIEKGLFKYIENATIRNLTINHSGTEDSSNSWDIGSGAILAFSAKDSLITNVTVSGHLTFEKRTIGASNYDAASGAGLIAEADNTQIISSKSGAKIEYTPNQIDSYVGGLVAKASNGTIIKHSNSNGQMTCVAESDTQPQGYAGGLVGYLHNSQIEYASYTSKFVNQNTSKPCLSVAGLVARLTSSTINQGIYDEIGGPGLVRGGKYSGGLVAIALSADIKNSYAVGEVQGNEYLGGLIATLNSSIILNSYYFGLLNDSFAPPVAKGGLIAGLHIPSPNDASTVNGSYWLDDSGSLNSYTPPTASSSYFRLATSEMHCYSPVAGTDNTNCLPITANTYLNWDQEENISEKPIWNFGTQSDLPSINIYAPIFISGPGDQQTVLSGGATTASFEITEDQFKTRHPAGMDMDVWYLIGSNNAQKVSSFPHMLPALNEGAHTIQWYLEGEDGLRSLTMEQTVTVLPDPNANSSSSSGGSNSSSSSSGAGESSGSSSSGSSNSSGSSSSGSSSGGGSGGGSLFYLILLSPLLTFRRKK